ncbi:class I SAM-dependent methyltransferase [Devosia lacusdianchii]|uniref:class I SAM-dependent methyltransferase n=1 Tax=Devosia lacusdianchii TaxID=2917991 RepID=UPI001F0669AC|nr:class I SAM-dependent methyltransferase [Devosia sp. JXJ CY 41]
MQITDGVRSILSSPAIYTLFQNLMGARSGWRKITDGYVQAKAGDIVLDIGCGPADVLDYLPQVQYWGFDISPEYIDQAKRKYGSRGQFFCKFFERSDLEILPKADIALLSGVLHHLDDGEAHGLLDLIGLALKPGGRLVTVDPCLVPGQNPVARLLIERDRGRNVRDEAGYRDLVQGRFSSSRVQIVHKAWIPYTHCFTVNRNA